MGTAILPIDLSTAVVGSTGDINIPTVTSEEGYHLLLFNESGCGLKLRFLQSDDTDNIPAGGWRKYPLIPGEDTVTWTVIYVLPNAPVRLLIGTLYKPGEKVPEVGTLGNSPIAIGGTVATSSVQTLSNENSVLGTKIVDIGTLTIGDLLDIFNDHFLWKVQQSGVAHQVLAGNTSGPPLQIGQVGDISEVLGNLTVDGTSTLTGLATTNGIVAGTTATPNLLMKNSGGSNKRILEIDPSNHVRLVGADANIIDILSQALSTVLSIDTSTGNITKQGTIAPENSSAPTANGATGTMTLYEAVVGAHLKIAMLHFVGYKGLAASAQALTLPTPFTDHAWVFGADLPSVGVAFLASAVAQTITVITGLGVGGGTSGPATVLKVKSFGSVRTGFDSLQVPAADANTTNDILLVIGF